MMEENLVKISELSKDEGKMLIKIAREAIKEKFGLEKLDLSKFSSNILDKKGLAFVTLESLHGNTTTLRGCIGYVEAIASLKEVVARAAEAAAFSDPRFPPLEEYELDNIAIEVTILTKPQPLKVDDPWNLPSLIQVGRDGLIVEKNIFHSGLLLPQVPMEYCWDSETFLAETCLKAGLDPDCWLDRKITIKKFEGIIFREVKPNSDEIIILTPNDVKCKVKKELSLL